jgi:hypothetical protein
MEVKALPSADMTGINITVSRTRVDQKLKLNSKKLEKAFTLVQALDAIAF